VVAASGTSLILSSCAAYALGMAQVGLGGGTSQQAYYCSTVSIGTLSPVIIAYLIDSSTAQACSGCNSALFLNAGGARVPPNTAPAYANCSGSQSQFVCTLVSSLVTGAGTASGVFSIGGLVSGNFALLLVGAVGLVAIAGISLLGSGENSESIHIIFVVGILLVVWTFLTAIEGFGGSNPNEIFNSLNSMPFTVPLGTLAYAILTLMFTMGAIGSVSRGGV
jgi:hypothetical protein